MTSDVNRFLGLEQCLHITRARGVVITRNGVRQVKSYCTSCMKILSGAIKASAIHRLTLPVIRDNREIYGETPPAMCDHCGEIGAVETHHWAPWALFNDAHDWPTSDLCPPCHRLWHRVVTPKISRRRAG